MHLYKHSLKSSEYGDISGKYWLAEGWSLILANPSRTRTWTRTQLNPEASYFLSWSEKKSELRLGWGKWRLQHIIFRVKGPFKNYDQDQKRQSGASSILQCPKSGLKGHGCSLDLQNQDREPKFWLWVCLRLVTIFKSWLRCQPPFRSLKQPKKPRIRT